MPWSSFLCVRSDIITHYALFPLSLYTYLILHIFNWSLIVSCHFHHMWSFHLCCYLTSYYFSKVISFNVLLSLGMNEVSLVVLVVKKSNIFIAINSYCNSYSCVQSAVDLQIPYDSDSSLAHHLSLTPWIIAYCLMHPVLKSSVPGLL